MSAAADVKSALADLYDVEREIGSGGMATVYLAVDRKHDRKVAIKILHAELAAVLGADRFLQEIRVTASLQHPHILGLIDSGLIGDDAGTLSGRPYYVMPFVEGQSLRQRLNQEQQLSVAEAVRVATEVASAIDYAHRHGVIHRDIKPENVLLHDGSAIVADFGIALAVTEAGGPRMTQTGMSLGTPSYMSPEQAMGERVITARSDIYSLGAVCYEMLSGEPPFTGPTVQAVVARVMTEEPRSLSAERRSVPPNVAAAVRQALQKVPADRFATAHDFAEALNNPAFAPSAALPMAAEKARDVRARRALYIVTAIATVMAATAMWGWTRPAPPKPVLRNQLVFDSTETPATPLPWTTRFALSPDGARLAHIGGKPSRLFVRPRNQLEGTAVPGSEGGTSPFFAPDGKSIGLMREGNLQIVSLTGAPPTLVTDTLVGVAGASWGRDGFIYADGRGDAPLVRVEAKRGGLPAWFTRIDSAAGEFDHTWPDVLPNGKGVLFTDASRPKKAKGTITYSIAVAAIPSGKHRVIVNDAVYARYAASGHLLYVTTNRTLMAVPFDQSSMNITGEPVAVVDGMRQGSLGSVDLAVTAGGTLLYGLGGAQGKWQLAWSTRDGKTQPVDSAWQGLFFNPTVSPDGKRASVDIPSSDQIHVWIKQLDRGPAVRLTFEGTDNFRPAWTADGQSVTYTSNAAGQYSLWTKRADGSAQAVLQLRRNVEVSNGVWSRDGKWLIYETYPGKRHIEAIRPGVDTIPVSLVASHFDAATPALSPDGRWLAYTADETGRAEVYVVPFPNASAAKWAVSTHGGSGPRWSHDGKELYYRDADANLVAVQVRTQPTFVPGTSSTLFPANGIGNDARPQYAVAPDGRFLVVRPALSTAPDKLIVVDNWFEELKSKVRK